MKFVVLYALVGSGFCLWALSALLRDDRAGAFAGIRHTLGNKATWRLLGLLALLSGIFWPPLLTIRLLSLVLPGRWFNTKDDDDDDLPPPNQESPI